MTNETYRYEPSIGEKRIAATIADEVKFAKEYGDSYFHGGTGLFGPLSRSLGSSGEGLSAFTKISRINNQMGLKYTNEQLADKINQEFENAELDYRFVLPDKFKTETPKRITEQTGGEIDEQMDTLMQSETVPSAVETHTMPDGTEMPGATHEEYEASMSDMESDDVMEDNYMDFILDEALEESEEQYLMEQLEANPELSMIFDKVFDVASEFAGSGPVDGPGSGVSDSIPARLSDGEFVFTTKAVEEIGADNLQQMMEDAEASADQRQPVANGGYMNGNEDDEYNRRQPLTEEEQLLDMQRANPRRFYRPISG